jgi:hypothetical protein
MALLDEIRSACADVASVARSVAIREEAIAGYSTGVAAAAAPAPEADPWLTAGLGPAERAAFVFTLDAINFGSGWFPTLRKRAGMSGYRTVEAGLRERFASTGPWSASELCALTAADVAHVLGQDPGHELMALYAKSLTGLGAEVARGHGGDWLAAATCAGASAEALVEHLAGWACFADVSAFEGRSVPFYKRAQITAADLQRAGVAGFADLARLTLFADNLVPHVLRLDGVLAFDTALVARIDAGELLEHGSPEEVEIRACAVHAVELVAAARPDLTAAAIDRILWDRGAGASYKAHPRHRTRCTAY